MKQLIHILVLIVAVFASRQTLAQSSQTTVDNDINAMLQTCSNQCNTAATLRSLLDIMVAATFQAQGANGLQISGTPIAGYVLTAIDATDASWQAATVGSSVSILASPAALIAATIATIPSTVNYVQIAAVTGTIPPATGESSCGLLYERGTTSATGIYGELLNTGTSPNIYWEPVYSTSPVKACEFGTVGDGHQTVNYMTGADTITGTDNTAIIQAALNYALQNQHKAVCLNDGKYMTSDTLHLGWGDTLYSTSLTSCNHDRETGTEGSTAGVTIYSTPTDRCAINIQGGRNVSVSGISLVGMNYYYQFATDFPNPWPTTAIGWLNPLIAPTGTNPGGLQRYAPYGGICEDAFMGAPPSTLGSFANYPIETKYPAFTGLISTNVSISSATPAVVTWPGANWLTSSCQYSPNFYCPIAFTAGSLPSGLSLNTLYYVSWLTNTTFNISATPGGSNIGGLTAASGLTAARQYGMQNSSAALLENDGVAGFAVNINFDSSTYNAQGDYLNINRVILASCVYCISVGNDQSRNVAIENIQFAFCYAGITNNQFGVQAGLLGGPITNMSGGECYEAFQVGALSDGFPLIIKDFYAEGLTRIGSFAGGSSSNDVIIDGFEAAYGSGLTGFLVTLPAAYIEATGGKEAFTINSMSVNNGPGRIDALFHGTSTVLMSGGTIATGAIALPNLNLPGIPVAFNYTGGLLVSGTASSFPTANTYEVRWLNPTSASYMTSQTAFGNMLLGKNVDFGTFGARAPFTQATRGFYDSLNQRWNEFALGPPNGNLLLASGGGYTGTPAAISACDVLTFTLLNTFQAANSQSSNVNPGDILYWGTDGTFFVVTQVAATVGGSYPITARQMNNMVVTQIPQYVLSGTYVNSGGTNGVMTLTMNQPTNYVAGQSVTLTGMAGTGAVASLDGTWTVLAGTTGTTLILQGPPSLTLTISTTAAGAGGIIPSGSCAANNISNSLLTGNTAIIHAAGTNYANVAPIGSGAPGNIMIPEYLWFGDFANGATGVKNISYAGISGNAGAALVAQVNVGDTIWSYTYSDPGQNWPYATGSNIATVTNANPGSLTLTQAADITGRFPILPLPIVGLGAPQSTISARAFATLPACAAGTIGLQAIVTDSVSATPGVSIVGAGSNTVLGICGSAWVVQYPL